MIRLILPICFFAAALMSGCGGGATTAATASVGEAEAGSRTPTFDADSAYAYVARQVELGPRVPGTPAHARCGDYIASELRRHGADTVIVQRGEVTAWNGDRLPIANITGRFGADASRRILIAAHYDTRPWADQESDDKLRHTPILGANDGGSGVGVILELARLVGAASPDVGVDFLLVDAEDYGHSQEIDGGRMHPDSDRTWCLGTQYWAASAPYAGMVKPSYAIVLDMVGGIDARFYREYASDVYARRIVDKVWAVASTTPYADRFVNAQGGAIVDDHLYINAAGIPAIDIVECRDGGFPDTWHTHADDLAHIDRSTLKAVGQTVCEVIYSE